jgi:hypothetical protein
VNEYDARYLVVAGIGNAVPRAASFMKLASFAHKHGAWEEGDECVCRAAHDFASGGQIEQSLRLLRTLSSRAPTFLLDYGKVALQAHQADEARFALLKSQSYGLQLRMFDKWHAASLLLSTVRAEV